jgi:hypothetical protein
MLSPRDFIAAQEREAEVKHREERLRLDDAHRKAQLAETAEHRRALMQRYDEDRASREAIAVGNAALRGAGGGGTRGSRAGGGGGDSDGDSPRLKPNELARLHADYVKRADEMAAGNDKINPDELANTWLMASTARLKRNAKSGQWGIEVGSPSNQYDIIAEYDSREAAAAALAELRDRRVRPSQGPLLRDDSREPGGSTRPPPPPSDFPGTAPAPARTLPPRRMTMAESQELAAKGASARAARSAAEKSPEYRALRKQRDDLITWGRVNSVSDIKALDAISAQMRAILDSAK